MHSPVTFNSDQTPYPWPDLDKLNEDVDNDSWYLEGCQKISAIFKAFCTLILALGNYMLIPGAIGFAIGGLVGAKIGACIGAALFAFQMLSMAWCAYKIYKAFNK